MPEAVKWLTVALELAREGADDREIAAAARSLAAAMIELGDTARGDAHLLEESLVAGADLGDAHGIAVCLETFAGLAATRRATRSARRRSSARATPRATRSARSGSRTTRSSTSAGSRERLRGLDTKTYSTHYEDGRVLTAAAACAFALGQPVAEQPARSQAV